MNNTDLFSDGRIMTTYLLIWHFRGNKIYCMGFRIENRDIFKYRDYFSISIFLFLPGLYL